MRLGPPIVITLSLVLAVVGCLATASIATDIIESRSKSAVQLALIEAGHDWTDVHTDGLQVHVGGVAPTESRRLNALHTAASAVDARRVVDGTTVAPSKPLTAPRFSMEILRNNEGVSLIGLVPAALDRPTMVNEIMALAQGAEVADLLQVASFPPPEGWDEAMEVGLRALAILTRTKISISAGEVSVDGISSSPEEKRDLEERLTRRIPDEVELTYNITSPRPVIAPFTLRFVIDETGARFDACSVDTQRGGDRIIAAAREAGLRHETTCRQGLGVPTTEWARAAILGIEAIQELGGGSITFSDANVSLVALDTTPQAEFDRVVGELESNLPQVFSLQSDLPEPVEVDGTGEGDGPPEFIGTRSPEGQVQLRGRLNNDMVRDTVESFAKARFGVNSVYTAARTDSDLPAEWPVRVLAGLQALSELDNGVVIVQEDYVEIRGTTGKSDGEAEIARILGEKLGVAQNYKIDVTYDEALDPVAALPTPDECVDKVNELLAETKITFEPGSTDITGPAVSVVNEIADILKACREVEMEIEIAGHTDSQGREEMNLELSQKRSDAVLDALMARRVLVSRITAQGYGESDPIADNETEEGREANRRIEFQLVKEAEPNLDSALDNLDGEAAQSDPDGDASREVSPEEAGDSEADSGEETQETADTEDAAGEAEEQEQADGTEDSQ